MASQAKLKALIVEAILTYVKTHPWVWIVAGIFVILAIIGLIMQREEKIKKAQDDFNKFRGLSK